MFEVIEIWEHTGLLYDISEEGNRLELAILMDDMARYMIKNPPFYQDITTVAFSVIRRIYHPSMTRIPKEELLYQLTLFYMRFPILSMDRLKISVRDYVDLWNELNFSEVFRKEGVEAPSPHSLDYEAEAIAYFCNFLIHDYTSKETCI